MSLIFPAIKQQHVLAFCGAYFVVQILGMLIFQLRWSADVAIFGSFWEAGNHLDYEMHPLVWIPKEGFAELNLNPPALLPLFQLFAMLEPQAGQSIWLFVSAGLYFATVWTLRNQVTRAQLFWLLTLPLAYQGIGLGQIYVLMFALGVGAWWCLRNDRTALAAVLIGVLVAMKPNLAVWGLVALAAGHFRPAVIAGLVALGLSVLPVLLYGPDIYQQWLAAAAVDRHGAFPHDVSLRGYFNRFAIPGSLIAIAAVLLGVLAWAARTRPSLYDLTPVAVLAGMLCSPLAWLDYILVAVPFIVDRPWRLPMLAAAFLLYGSVLAADTVHSATWIVWLASTIYIAPVLIMLAHFLRRASARDSKSESASGSEAPLEAVSAIPGLALERRT